MSEKTTKQPAWYNNDNALEAFQTRFSNQVNNTQQQQCIDLITKGYCVIPKAIPETVIDQIVSDYDRAGENRDTYLVRKGGEYFRPGPLGIVGRRKRLIDFYIPCQAALEAVLAKPVTDILNLFYEEPAMAFQSLLFQFGSKQTLHQDPAYVVIEKPELLLASWIALEDIQPGSGELVYYNGSHRQIGVNFESGSTVWDRNTDSISSNHRYSDNLIEQCEQAGLEKEHFLAKKGDVLIWHANLVHGGGEILDEDLTRKSLVTHYCPASCSPNYFKIHPDTVYKQNFADGFYASRHYDIRPGSNNPQPIYTGGKDLYSTE